MIVGGWSKEHGVQNIEIIDLGSISSICEDMPNIPKRIDAEVSTYAGLGENKTIYACLPIVGAQQCYKFGADLKWTFFSQLQLTRNHSAVLPASDPPFYEKTPSGGHVVFTLIGGTDYR